MEDFDARKLSSDAQELLRRQAVEGVIEKKMTQKQAAEFFHVSSYAIHKWVKAYKAGGSEGLAAKPQGRPKTDGKLLLPWQQAQIVWMITDKCPDQHQLPFMLWTRNAVRQLIKHRFGIELSLATLSRYLKRWGFSPQKPIYRAFERDPKKVTRWLQTEYPVIKARAKAEGAEILWGDEMGVRSDHTCGRSFSPRGQTPVASGSAKRWSCNMISAISNAGTMRFMLYEDKMTAAIFLKFLGRLIHGQKKKIFLIVDNLKVHHALKVQPWVKEHEHQIELFFLPPYAPDLNPDELLNQDVKANACHSRLIRNTQQLKSDLLSYLRSVQKTPQKIQNFFQKSSVNYAA
jgi:transposase